MCLLILFASGFLSFFRGPNLENRCFSLVKQRFSRNLRFRYSSIFLSKSVSIFDDFCHENSVKTDLKNTRAFLRCFSHFFRRFWLSFWTLDGATKREKGGKKEDGCQKGPRRVLGAILDAILGGFGPLGSSFGSHLEPLGALLGLFLAS